MDLQSEIEELKAKLRSIDEAEKIISRCDDQQRRRGRLGKFFGCLN